MNKPASNCVLCIYRYLKKRVVPTLHGTLSLHRVFQFGKFSFFKSLLGIRLTTLHCVSSLRRVFQFGKFSFFKPC
jgi:hypothetical protein